MKLRARFSRSYWTLPLRESLDPSDKSLGYSRSPLRGILGNVGNTKLTEQWHVVPSPDSSPRLPARFGGKQIAD
ncbi:unnamed protein product [marine sediment metagenome]|uniref:Uncharacterized protein n=1 Tax=marine sediment metagenome TaxID=412755 RepID=X0S453_9ZZZZ